MNTPTEQTSHGVSRRSFMRRTAIGASLLPLSGFLASSSSSFGQTNGGVTAGDIAILKFLAAAELVEDDLWQQYCELAVGNVGFRGALRAIDPALPQYICDDRDDELSHANFINGFLISIGQAAVNLDSFRTLPSLPVQGARQVGRLTNLRSLTVDTSWYRRYRREGNPDFGDTFRQLVDIVNRPTVPTSDGLSQRQLLVIAQTAAFHFGAIEQGGSSLYLSLLTKASALDVVAILGSIGPTEFYHFGVFQTALENIVGTQASDGVVFPDLRNFPIPAELVMPEPCTFLRSDLPLCSVIRPRSTEKAGAVAAATGLVHSGLFTGQTPAFFNAVVALAQAADAAERTC